MKESVIKSVTRILDNYLEVTRHRKTPERYTILRAIYNHKGHFTLDELKVELEEKYTFPVSRATLYNTLNLFRDIRLVMRHHIQGITKYEAFYGNNNHCHQILSSDLHDLWEGDRDYLPGDCGGCRERRTETLPQRRFQSLHLWCLQYLSGKTHA